MFKVGIIGASGYTGHEILKLLKAHPEVSLEFLTSRAFAGQPVRSVYPDYQGEEMYADLSPEQIVERRPDLVFLAVPHGVAHDIAGQLDGMKIIDLSHDHRNVAANPDWVYGLPELFANKIKTAKHVANPGCYATASLLAALPIQGYADRIIFDCKSGWSGAGRSSKYAEDPSLIEDNLIPYKLTNHSHKDEIAQFLTPVVSFTPHVIDTFQGMLCTAHILLNQSMRPDHVFELYNEAYPDFLMIEVTSDPPDIKSTQGTNLCKIGGFEIDETDRLVIIASLDNLLKGAASQAVQNMNLMLGLEINAGLDQDIQI